MSTVRTRMAPSPTGEYHIGHIRTVLYNYAFAKRNNGKFIIRIEDTDRERYVEGAVGRILDVIREYGLNWDEGPDKEGECGPYTQSERLDIYREHAQKLIDSNHAYHCFCSKKDLEAMRKKQQEQGMAKTMYDGGCREIPPDLVEKHLKDKKPYVVRLKVPADQIVKVKDEVYGELEFNTNEIDDTVLLKSDGYPTYHLAVVVDDHLMGISHIMRGNDWLPSTPKHVLLYNAFGWELPTFVHLPNLKELGENKKLSKRFGAVFAEDFLREGYLVEVLLNFLMLLGWNPGGEKEIYTLKEFVEIFDIKRIHKTDLVAFDREKLLWLNGTYIRNMPLPKLCKAIRDWSEKYTIDLHCGDFSLDYHLQVLGLIQERLKTFSEYVGITHYFYQDPQVNSDLLTKYAKSHKRSVEITQGFVKVYEGVKEHDWKTGHLEKVSHDFVGKREYKNKEAFMTLRVAVTGEHATPPIFDTLEVLGKKAVIERLKRHHSCTYLY